MSNPLRERADRRFEEALNASGARDPREFYRTRLRELKTHSPEAYRRAVAYYEERLIPAVVVEGSDPLAEWMGYGRYLAELTAAGETVQLDPTGRSHPYAAPVPPDHLVLHLPRAAAGRALVVGLPRELSPAQRAAYDLLVRGSLG
jgi:hypothetical protein